MNERIQEIRERANAAWHGEWRGTDGYSDQVFTYNADGSIERHICDVRGWGHFTGKGSGALRMTVDEANAQMTADVAFIANARQDIPYLLDLIESQQREIDRLQQENKAMEDNVFVACGVANLEEYSPITICGLPIQNAIKIIEIAKREADSWRKPIKPEELTRYINKPYFHQSLDGNESEWKILKNADVAKYPKLYHYGERWLAYAIEPEGEAAEDA